MDAGEKEEGGGGGGGLEEKGTKMGRDDDI